jgi:ribokinase
MLLAGAFSVIAGPPEAHNCRVRERIAFVGRAVVDLTVRVPERAGAGRAAYGGPLVATAGGKAVNQAYAAARLGGDVALVANAGADHWGDLLVRTLDGVNLDGFRLLPGVPTGAAIIEVTPDGESYVTLALSEGAELSAEQVRDAFRRRTAEIVVCQLDLPPGALEGLSKPRLLVGSLIPSDPSVLSTLDLFVVNVFEAAAVLGVASTDAIETAEGLRDLGIPAVVVTAGADGAVVSDRGGTKRVRAEKVEVVDSTGAGDAFLGALAVDLAAGRPLTDAVATATVVGSRAVQNAGSLYQDGARVAARE